MSVDLRKVLWLQDDHDDNRRRAYVEKPEFYGLTASVPMGIDHAYRKYLDLDEALSMANALIDSVALALVQSMEPDARRKLVGQLDVLVIVTQNALRWRETPRQVDEPE